MNIRYFSFYIVKDKTGGFMSITIKKPGVKYNLQTTKKFNINFRKLLRHQNKSMMEEQVDKMMPTDNTVTESPPSGTTQSANKTKLVVT
jgi:hypothetical protein